MILIAAFALGLWVAPEGFEAGVRNAITLPIQYRSLRLAASGSSRVLVWCAQPMASAWTLGILAASLWRRPSPRRLARRPGAMACVAAVLAMLVAGPANLAVWHPNLIPGLPFTTRLQVYLGYALRFQRGECGLAVAAAWTAMALAGRWRAQPDAIDRLGRAMGFFWLALIPVTWVSLMV
jgi:hypothetical protein